MRDKLKPVSDWTGRNPTTYYLHDIALSLRELAAAKSEPLDLTPGALTYPWNNPCNCEACKPRTISPEVHSDLGCGKCGSDLAEQIVFDDGNKPRVTRCCSCDNLHDVTPEHTSDLEPDE